MAKIEKIYKSKLLNSKGEQIFPITITTAVYNSENENLDTILNKKQDVLISGENIATINGESILQGKDIVIEDREYDANNIIFTTDLTITAPVGVHTIPPSGSKTLLTSGKSVKQVMDLLFAEEKNPTITQPSVNISAQQNKAYEVGTKVTPTYNATFNSGSYQFGPTPTRVTVQSWQVADTRDEFKTTSNGQFSELTVEDSTNYTITAKANHSEGSIPFTNLNNEYSEGKIVAGTKSKTSAAITGYRNMFYGFTTEQQDSYNSALIRGLSARQASNNKFTITVPPNKLEIIFACPASIANNIKVYSNTVFQNITATKVSGTIDVEGANGYTTKPYNVWHVKLGQAYTENQSWDVTFLK